MSRKNNDIFNQEQGTLSQNFSESASGTIEWSVPTESIPLPSSGLIYKKGSFFHNKETVQIKAMTAKEEDILLSAAYYKSGTVMKELIKSCINNVGVDPDQLIPGDKNALIIGIRITGYGTEYPVEVSCSKCGHREEKAFDLSDLEIKRLSAQPIEVGKNAFSYTLPVSGKEVIFKILNGKEEKARQEEVTNIKLKLGESSAGLITSILHHAIISIDGVSNSVEIRKFVNSMPARDSKSLRTYMTSIQPGIDTDVKHTCSNCGSITTVRLPIGGKFFFPD